MGRREIFVRAGQVSGLTGNAVEVGSAAIDLRWFERREGEVLLRADVLGHRLLEVGRARLVRPRDLRLSAADGEWVLDGADTHWRPRRLPGFLGGHERRHEARDWQEFEPLIGHLRTALSRGRFTRVRRLKPAQIADLLEEASGDERTEILGRVHADPELEAYVLEELDEELACRLLGARTDADIAPVLARIGADDAADAISELPQHRRQPVLDLLPAGQQVKVRTLMGFNPSSAGGLMGTDFLALTGTATVGEALEAVRRSETLPPEVLSTVHAVDVGGRLLGTARVVTLLQSDHAGRLADTCDHNPVRIGPGTDVTDVAVLMTDYNLTTIPVVDADRRMLGLITVDDVLEVTLPDSLHRSFRDAKAFYTFFTVLVVIAVGIVLIPGAPLGVVTEAVQALAGLLLPSASVFLLLLCNDREVLGPWVNRGWLNIVATVIIATLLMLSGTLMATTMFPHINATQMALWLSIALAAGLAAAGIALHLSRARRGTAEAGPPPAERGSWRMPPLAMLKPVTWSPAIKLGMLALRAYLLIAALLLLVKAIQLGTG